MCRFSRGRIATLVMCRLTNVEGRPLVATMLLAGIAINALTGAGTGFLTFMATDGQLRNITLWSLGSLEGTTWMSVSATDLPHDHWPLVPSLRPPAPPGAGGAREPWTGAPSSLPSCPSTRTGGVLWSTRWSVE
jgi:hypothetical protein